MAEDKLEVFYNTIKSNPNIKGLPSDYNTFKTALADAKTAESFFYSIKSNKNITGLPETFNDFYEGVGLKKKDLSQSDSPSGFAPSQGIKPGTSVFPQQALGSQQFEPMAPEQRYKADIPKGGFGEFSKYLYNKSVEGVGNAASGIVDFAVAAGTTNLAGAQIADLKLQGLRSTVTPKIKETVNKAKIDQDKSEVKEYDEGFITSSLGGLAQSIPAMATPGGIALFGQGYDAGISSINNSKLAGELSETEKSMFGLGVGQLSAMLEKAGLDGIFKSSKATNEFAEKIAVQVLDKLFDKGVPVTVQAFTKESAKVLASMVKGGVIEGTTGGLQEVGNITAEQLFNKYKGKEIFDTQSFGQMAGRVVKAAGQEAVGGKVLGGVASIASNIIDSDVSKKAVATGNAEVVDAIKTKLDEQLQNQEISQEEYDGLQEYIANTEAINTKIPAAVPAEQREKMIDITADRNLLMADQANLEQELEATDIAFKPRVQARIDAIQEQVDVYNDAILGLESPITYRQTEKGFEKVDGNRVEEITEEQFNYAKDNKLEGIEFEGATEGATEVVTPPTQEKIQEANENKLVVSKNKTDKYSIKLLGSDEYVSRELMELAYANDIGNNPELGGGGQTLDRIIERGGYSKAELVNLLKDQIKANTQTEVVAEPAEIATLQIEGTDGATEGAPQPLSDTDEIENSTGTYSFEVVNTINGPEKRYYRKEPKAKLEKNEISEEEYNLNTGATPVYDAEGNVDLTVIKNTPETGLTDEQFEAVKEKYYAKVSNGGSPGQAAQSAMTAARSYVGDRILTAAQYQAIKKNLLPIASQYTGAVRKMQNPNIAEVQEQKDVLRNAYAERIMGWMDKLKTFAIDDEQRVLSAIRKQLGKGSKLAEAAYKNINRYSSKASQVIKEANNDIFKGLSKKLDFEFDGKKFSESELFSYLIQMDRIKNINQMMKDKFDRFEALRKKKDRTDEENKALRDTKKYLNDRRVLRSVAGGFELLPYEAGHSIDNAGADQNIEDIKNIVGEEKFSDFENRKTLYSDIYRLLLEEQLLAEIISQEQYDAMSKYDYAPTMHLDKLIDTELKSSRNAGGKVKSGNGLAALKGGSESALSDAYDVQLIFDINSTFKRVFSNRASRKLFEATRANPDNGLVELANPIMDPVTKMPKFDSKGNFRYPKAPSGYEYIPVFIDGAEYKLIAPAEFADMYKSGSAKLPKDIDNVVNFLAKITGVTFTRNLITGINPAFGVYQTVMDMPQAVIATDAFSPSFTVSMAQLGKQMGSVAKDVQTRSGWFTKAEDYGALQDMTTSEKNKIGDEVNWMGKRKSIDNSLLSQTIRKGEEFNQKFEHLTRVAVFKQMWEKLAKENPDMRQEDIGILAAAEAGKVVDYSRGGVFSKFMSKFLPYFNARIQVFRSSASGYKNNPTKLGIHSLELMAFTSMALAYTIGVADDDDEMLEEYLKQPQDMRNKFVLVRNKYSDDPDKMFVKLPIPAILIPIKVLFEESLLDALGKKDFNWENVANSFKELSPVDKAAFTSNPMMSAFIKYAYNKDMYYNKDIVVNETEKFDWTEGQNNPKIEEMYKQLGKLSNKIGFKEGISPERAKAAVESFGLRANKNPFVSIPFGALDAALAYAAGNEEEVKNRVGSDVGAWLYKSSGIPSRVFASQAKIDAEFKELKADMTKEATLKREEDKKAYREAFEQGGEKALRKILEDVDNEEDIVKTFKNEKLLEDRPGWYKELVFAPSNKEKALVINYYLRNATVAKKKEVIKDLKKNFISSESEVWDEIVD